MDAISTAEAAKILGVTPRKLYRFIDSGRLSTYREGLRIVLDRDEVARFDGGPDDDPGDTNDREPRVPFPPTRGGAISLDPPPVL